MIPCRAGTLTAVVYSNGDVSVCETHAPLGNLRDRSFREIWHSAEAEKLRASIARKDCYCTNEVFLWPSIVYQPWHLLSTMLSVVRKGGAKPSAPLVLPVASPALVQIEVPERNSE